MDTYSIYFGDQTIGEATVDKQGLFYNIHCLCRLCGAVPFRVMVKGDRETDLGLCIPMGDHFGLKSSIPINKVGNSQLEFWISPKHNHKIRDCVTVSPDEPFRYLSKLTDAYLVSRNEIAFKETEKSPSLPGNDQNP